MSYKYGDTYGLVRTRQEFTPVFGRLFGSEVIFLSS